MSIKQISVEIKSRKIIQSISSLDKKNITIPKTELTHFVNTSIRKQLSWIEHFVSLGPKYKNTVDIRDEEGAIDTGECFQIITLIKLPVSIEQLIVSEVMEWLQGIYGANFDFEKISQKLQLNKFLSIPWYKLHFREKVVFLAMSIHCERKVTCIMLGKRYLNSKKDSDFVEKKLEELLGIYSWPIVIFSQNQKFEIGRSDTKLYD